MVSKNPDETPEDTVSKTIAELWADKTQFESELSKIVGDAVHKFKQSYPGFELHVNVCPVFVDSTVANEVRILIKHDVRIVVETINEPS